MVCGLDGGFPTETSLPSQTSSFVLGCACCQKGAVSVCSAQWGALESISISAASSWLHTPLTRALCTDQHSRLKAKHIILSTDWIQMRALFFFFFFFFSPSLFLLSSRTRCLSVTYKWARSIICKSVLRCRRATQTRVHTQISLLDRRRDDFKVQAPAK